MPTPLDQAMKSKNLFLGKSAPSLCLAPRPSELNGKLTRKQYAAFGGLVTAVGVWSIWGGDMFPSQEDPTGEPETWTREEMRAWLAARNLYPQDGDTREQLLERIKANLRIPRRANP